jgi:hypothetical protein
MDKDIDNRDDNQSDNQIHDSDDVIKRENDRRRVPTVPPTV